MTDFDKNFFIREVLRLANDSSIFVLPAEGDKDYYAKGINFGTENFKKHLRALQRICNLDDYNYNV